MKWTPLKRKTPLKAKADPRIVALKAVVLARAAVPGHEGDYWCEFCAHIFRRKDLDLCHLFPRRVAPHLKYDPEAVKLGCRTCHNEYDAKTPDEKKFECERLWPGLYDRLWAKVVKAEAGYTGRQV